MAKDRSLVIAVIGIVALAITFGAILSPMGPADATRTFSNQCNDIDGGKNFDAKSSVTQGRIIRTDYCRSKSIVREYYCIGNNIKSTTYDCRKEG
jgi:hypothetical protein